MDEERYGCLKSAAGWAPLAIRIALGVIFIAHGAQKLFGIWGGPGIEGFAAGLANMNIPLPLFSSWVVALVEFVGGIAVLLGALTTLFSTLLLVNMIVAVSLVHFKAGFFLSEGGFEYNLALIAMALSLILSGPGVLSVDKRLRWRF